MKLLFIVGSLREQSFNRQLAEAAARMFENQAEISFLNYEDVPLFNQDRENPVPEAVAAARQTCLDNDAIWIFSPEYNGQIPGVLKNLLDWQSRPVRPGESQTNTAVYGKPVTCSGVGGKNQTRGCRRLLNALLTYIHMKVMKEPQTGLTASPEAWKTSVLDLDDEQKAELQAQGEAFLKFVQENLPDQQ